MHKALNTRQLYIYAGSYEQAANFAREKGLQPQNWVLLTGPERLRGIRGGYFIRCGTWFERPNYREIDDMLIKQEMKEVKGSLLDLLDAGIISVITHQSC